VRVVPGRVAEQKSAAGRFSACRRNGSPAISGIHRPCSIRFLGTQKTWSARACRDFHQLFLFVSLSLKRRSVTSRPACLDLVTILRASSKDRQRATRPS
jgi:hypothetical protein